MSSRWTALGRGLPTLGQSVERGVTALKEWLSEDSLYLLPVPARSTEVTAFEFSLPPDYVGKRRTVRIGFPAEFPTESLVISVDPSPWLSWPHAMRNGICLFGARQLPASGQPEEVVYQSMNRLGRLVVLVMPDSDPSKRQREFDQEITSYWNQQVRASAEQLILLRRPDAASQLLVLSDPHPSRGARASHWLSHDKADLAHHLERVRGEKMTVRDPASAGFYIPLLSAPDACLPAPTSLREWLTFHVQDSELNEFETWFKQTTTFPLRWLVLGLPGDDSTTYYALALRCAGMKSNGNRNYGSRAARRPQQAAPSPSLAPRLGGARIHVLDRRQVHSRDRAQSDTHLASKHIVVVGIGSLGSAIVSPLARSGVGNLTLVDPELLEDANLGRHSLGMDDLGRNKAQAMRDRLQRDIPAVDVTAIPQSFQVAWAKYSQLFRNADLILSATADWPSELALWRIKSRGAAWSFIQAWSEPFAHVGHALSAPPGAFDGCSLFDATGRFHHKMTRWPDDGIRSLPACGESYIPGGPISLAMIGTTIARVAIGAVSRSITSPTWYTTIDSPKAIGSAGGVYLGPPLPENTKQLVLERPWPVLSESVA